MIGIDPRPHTLRELSWMHVEKKRVMGEIATWQMCLIAQMFGSKPIDPSTINPYAVAPEKSAAMRKLEDWQRRRAWRIKHGEKK